MKSTKMALDMRILFNRFSNFTLHSIHILRNQSPSAISEPVYYEVREGNELLWKKRVCVCVSISKLLFGRNAKV